MALTDTAIRNAKFTDKQSTVPWKIFDGDGLFLLMSPAGGKLWRLKYYHQKKEKYLALGAYPAVGLKEARQRRDDARKLIASGIDPAEDKKQKAEAAKVEASNTFRTIGEEVLALAMANGKAESTLLTARWHFSLLEAELGDLPVSSIKPMQVKHVLDKLVKKDNVETARRVCALARRIFAHAVITGRAEVNPASDLVTALPQRKVKHYAAIVKPEALGILLNEIEGYSGQEITRYALKLTAHLFKRPGEVRHMEWSELDFENRVWRIPDAKMKMRSEHVEPLSRQVVALLTEVKALGLNGPYVFPAIHTSLKPLSENTVNVALRRLGYSNDEMTAHGFRSTASTLLNECGKWQPDAIERALAHKDRDKVRGTYNRGDYWDERVEMAQYWSDYLDELRERHAPDRERAA